MDTKKLRQKILDLAIRGKLVPQDPNDEPASVLLERIRAEKEHLIKEGKIKRTKKPNASDISHYENVPFEVPENWEWVTVGDIFTHNTGKALNSSNSQGEIMSYITTSNLYWNRFDLSVIKEMPFTESEVAKCTVTRGDLLVCEGGDVGRAAIWNYDFDIRIQNHIHRLRSIIQLNHLFYYHVFYLFKSLNLIGGKGVAIQGLSSSDLAKLLVPLPPISEQNRIVSELNRWLSVVDQIELDQYSLTNTIADIKNRILCLAISGKLVGQDISDEPAIELLKKINPSYISCDNRHYENVPTGWQLAKIKDVFTINPKNKVDDDIDAGFVSMAMIDDGYRDSYQFEKKKWALIKNGFTHFKDGDIAVAKISPCLENRKSTILKNLPNGIGAGTTELHIFRSAIVDPKFALYFFKSDHFINQCVGTFNGVVGQQRVGKNIIEDIMFPLPPYKEQRRISERITQIFMCLDKITEEL